jgi:hypothetical protein
MTERLEPVLRRAFVTGTAIAMDGGFVARERNARGAPIPPLKHHLV